MDWFTSVCLSVVLISSMFSIINSVGFYSRFKSGLGVDFSVLDIIIIVAGLPGTVFAGVVILGIAGAEQLAKIKVFSIGKSVQKEVKQ